MLIFVVFSLLLWCHVSGADNNTTTTSATSTTSSPTPVPFYMTRFFEVGVAVVASLVILIALVGCCLLYRKRRKERMQQPVAIDTFDFANAERLDEDDAFDDAF